MNKLLGNYNGNSGPKSRGDDVFSINLEYHLTYVFIINLEYHLTYESRMSYFKI